MPPGKEFFEETVCQCQQELSDPETLIELAADLLHLPIPCCCASYSRSPALLSQTQLLFMAGESRADPANTVFHLILHSDAVGLAARAGKPAWCLSLKVSFRLSLCSWVGPAQEKKVCGPLHCNALLHPS